MRIVKLVVRDSGMKIIKLIVEDENGVTHVYEGEGFVHPIRSQSFKADNYAMSVTAHLVLPSPGKITA